MHNFPSVLAVLVAATSSSKTSSGSAYGTLIFILLLAVLAYLFFIRPRSQQARRQRDLLQDVGPGDEVLTGAGIFGRVLDVQPDRVTIETAPGTRLTVLRSTIARRITEQAEAPSEWAEPDSSGSGSGSAEALYPTHEALGDGHAGGDHDAYDDHGASDEDDEEGQESEQSEEAEEAEGSDRSGGLQGSEQGDGPEARGTARGALPAQEADGDIRDENEEKQTTGGDTAAGGKAGNR